MDVQRDHLVLRNRIHPGLTVKRVYLPAAQADVPGASLIWANWRQNAVIQARIISRPSKRRTARCSLSISTQRSHWSPTRLAAPTSPLDDRRMALTPITLFRGDVRQRFLGPEIDGMSSAALGAAGALASRSTPTPTATGPRAPPHPGATQTSTVERGIALMSSPDTRIARGPSPITNVSAAE
jgi:hypothetical protein